MGTKVVMICCLMLFCIYGCASSLIISEPQSGPPNGVRVHETITCIVEMETIGKDKDDKTCTYTTEEIKYLPIGITYDINFLAALFAKSEFAVELKDNGSVSKVTLNSTPQLAEMIKAIGEAAGGVKEGQLLVEGCFNTETKIKSIRRVELTEKLKK